MQFQFNKIFTTSVKKYFLSTHTYMTYNMTRPNCACLLVPYSGCLCLVQPLSGAARLISFNKALHFVFLSADSVTQSAEKTRRARGLSRKPVMISILPLSSTCRSTNQQCDGEVDDVIRIANWAIQKIGDCISANIWSEFHVMHIHFYIHGLLKNYYKCLLNSLSRPLLLLW